MFGIFDVFFYGQGPSLERTFATIAVLFVGGLAWFLFNSYTHARPNYTTVPYEQSSPVTADTATPTPAKVATPALLKSSRTMAHHGAHKHLPVVSAK